VVRQNKSHRNGFGSLLQGWHRQPGCLHQAGNF
jgi:hypothetical protein